MNANDLPNILTIIVSIRHSLERAMEMRISDEQRYAELKTSFLKFENVRLDFITQYRSRRLSPPDMLVDMEILYRFNTELASLSSDIEFRNIASTVRLRMQAPSSRLNEMPEEIRKHIAPGSGANVMSAIDLLLDMSSTLRPSLDAVVELESAPNEPDADIRQLKSMVPSQKLAPLQFKIDDGRIGIINLKSTPADEDLSNIAQARDRLVKGGNQIIDELKSSNCDRRLIEGVQFLQNSLLDTSNIIETGLLNIGCSVSCDVYKGEMSDAVTSMLRAHTMGVSMYVAQFPEWGRFVENVAASEIEKSDLPLIQGATVELVAKLNDHPDFVDPAIPKTFENLEFALRNPQAAFKRVAFAIIRSIENLVSKIFVYISSFAEKTATKTVDGLSSVLSKAAVITILSIGVDSALSISPLSSKIKELSWLKNAIELVQKEISHMK